MADQWEAFLIRKPDLNERKQVEFEIEFRRGDEVFRPGGDGVIRVDRFTEEWYHGFVKTVLETLNFEHEIASIDVGKVPLLLTEGDPPAVVPARQAYWDDLVLFRRLKFESEFRPDVLDSKEFNDVKTRLADNHDPTYRDMY